MLVSVGTNIIDLIIIHSDMILIIISLLIIFKLIGGKQMSQFYASVTGSRGSTVTKTGDKSTGMHAHIRGWNIGIKVNCIHHEGKDIIRVYKTSGSTGSKSDKFIAEYKG